MSLLGITKTCIQSISDQSAAALNTLILVCSETTKALAEEFGAAAGSEKNFLHMLKLATDPDFGFMFIVFGLKIRFFNSYRSEFKVSDDINGRSQSISKKPGEPQYREALESD